MCCYESAAQPNTHIKNPPEPTGRKHLLLYEDGGPPGTEEACFHTLRCTMPLGKSSLQWNGQDLRFRPKEMTTAAGLHAGGHPAQGTPRSRRRQRPHTTSVRRHSVLAGARGSRAACKSHTLIFLQRTAEGGERTGNISHTAGRRPPDVSEGGCALVLK